MQVAQINARLDQDIKREGDAILARYGTSATEAVRSLWGYMARSQRLPDYMAQDLASDQADAKRDATGAADHGAQGAGLALRMAQSYGLHTPDIQSLSYQQLRELAFEELLEEGEFHA